MEPRISQTQLNQLIAEVEQLSQQRQNDLDRAEVEQILRELNLPPELLGEAIVQLQRRKTLAAEQNRRRRYIIAAIAVFLFAIAGTLLTLYQQQQSFTRITAQQDRITLVQDTGSNLATIARPTEVYYRVTLKDAPIGKQLSLACNWFDPTGQIVKQNRYQTQEITTPVWETRCRYAIGADTPTGTWTVQMLLENRVISDATFDVK